MASILLGSASGKSPRRPCETMFGSLEFVPTPFSIGHAAVDPYPSDSQFMDAEGLE